MAKDLAFPKVIYTFWPSPGRLPAGVESAMRSWRRKSPEYTIRVLNQMRITAMGFDPYSKTLGQEVVQTHGGVFIAPFTILEKDLDAWALPELADHDFVALDVNGTEEPTALLFAGFRNYARERGRFFALPQPGLVSVDEEVRQSFDSMVDAVAVLEAERREKGVPLDVPSVAIAQFGDPVDTDPKITAVFVMLALFAGMVALLRFTPS